MKRQTVKQGWKRAGPALALSGLALLSWILPASAADATGSFAPRPAAPNVNQKMVELGRHLFFDTRLSGDTSRSCATCHSPAKGWADGLPLSAGYTGSDYFRNAPTVLNAAEREFFMWDGRLDGRDLGTLVRDKVTESHFMNADGRLVQERLKQVPEYVEMWQEIFGNDSDPYGPRMFGVVGEFVKTLRSNDAPFDAYLAGNARALDSSARRGKEVFTGAGNCIACHNGPTLSDNKFHRLGVPDNADIWNNPDRGHTILRFFATHGTPNYMNIRSDVGLFAVTKDAAHKGKFLTPSLRELVHTAPYMHNGVFATLEEVVDFYNRGGGDGSELAPLNLSNRQMSDLVAFLKSMSGAPVPMEAPKLPDYQARTLGKN
jgi:cytochrome c peroxidase